jgi:hypothetical protein
VELAFGAEPDGDQAAWQWTDVSADVPAQEITITRGRADESSEAQPTSASLRLDNLHGHYTPDNPMSPYWPHVGLGTPCRIGVQVPDVRHVLTAGTPTGGATTPHTSALDIADEIDIRVEAGLAWDSPYPQVLASKWEGSERSWALAVWENALFFVASTDGTTAGSGWNGWRIGVRRRGAARATLHADSVAGTTTWRLYQAPSMAGPWVLLTEYVSAGYSPLHAGTAPVRIGGGVDAGQLADLQQIVTALPPVAGTAPAGELYRAEIRDGIDGTVVADPDLTLMAVGDTEHTDGAGLIWTLGADAEVTDWHVRMAGMVDGWQPVWPHGDLSDPTRPDEVPGEAHVDITVAGILRRLGQGRPPVQSTLRRRIPTADPPPKGYWSMEDGADATEAASALPGGAPLALTGVQWAADTTLGGSAALPTMGQVTDLSGAIVGATVGGWHAEMVYRLDTMPATERTVLRLSLAGASGGVVAVRGRVSTAGIRVQALDDDNAVVAQFLSTNAAGIAAFTGGWNRMQLFSYQSGGDCFLRMAWRDVGADSYFFAGTTWSGSTVGRVTAVRGIWGSDWQGAGLGHLGVWDVGGTGLTTPGVSIYNGADDGWVGQLAAQRIADVAALEGIPLVMRGDLVGTERVGPERPRPALDLIAEAAAVDGGVLGEQRVAPGLEYLTRASFYNLSPALELTARDNEIAEPFAPTLDDQRIRNDVTITREGGASARVRDEESVTARGEYATSETINAYVDGQLEPRAAWELHLGTWPGMRYPSLTMDLGIAPHLIPAWLTTDTGDRVRVDGLPPQHPPGAVDLLMEGYAETLSPVNWGVTANCSPAGPWTTATVTPETPAAGDPPSHADAADTVLAQGAAAADTTLWVDPQTDPDWVVTGSTEAIAEDWPVDIVVGGEQVTLTATGARQDAPAPGAGVSDTSHTTDAHVAPSVDAPSAAGLLVCAWASYSEPVAYTAPGSMTEVAQGSGTWSTGLLCTQVLAASGATGTRTATLAAIDSYGAISLVVPGAAVVEEALDGYAAAGDVILTTAAGTEVGWWLLAVQAWDEDPGAAMVPPSGTGWHLVTESVAVGLNVARVRAWARRVETAGAHEVTLADGAVTDNRGWLLVLSGTDGALVGTGQPLTVTRSVNGVIKPHTAGAAVRLADPAPVPL